MHNHSMIERVAQLMRRAVAQAILPRFRALHASEIEEKSPGEQVTAADREAEALLTAGLLALLPGSAVLGEEAASAQPDTMQRLSGYADLWIVDPLDGTSNFVEGKPVFSVMVALMRHGETVASWMLDPLTDILAVAQKGGGAWLGGQRIVTTRTVPDERDLRGAVLTRFLSPELRSSIESRAQRIGGVLPGLRCAGHEYPDVATGVQNFVLFWRTEPWDHAPGALFIIEAGGHIARLDGTPYVPLDGGKGLLVAQNRETWLSVARCLLA
jgi:fructose-1,6-bisphosphatase/inositol monophosphatase family enzyme